MKHRAPCTRGARSDFADRSGHELNLLRETVDELASVAASDGELALSEEWVEDRDLALVAFGVDYPYARRDRDVVDVCAAARDAPVVEQDRPGVEVLLKERRDVLFPGGADRPCCLVLRRFAEREHQATDPWMSLPEPELAVGDSTIVLASRARSGDPGVEVTLVGRGHTRVFDGPLP